jgi:hypothetical protein
MAKRQATNTPVQELTSRLNKLMDTRLKAYQSSSNQALLLQIEQMIEETQINLYTEQELELHRNKQDDDGEQWIV